MHEGKLSARVWLVRAHARRGAETAHHQPVALVGEPRLIEPIAEQLDPHPARVGVDVGQRGETGLQARLDAAPQRAHAQLAPLGEVGAQIEPASRLADPVVGNAVFAGKYAAVALAIGDVGRDEEVAVAREGLIELGEDVGILADLRFELPFRAVLRQPGGAVARQHVEVALALVLGGERQAEAQVVRPGVLFVHFDDERAAGRPLLDAVVHRLEIAAAVDAPQVLGDRFLGDLVARPGLDHAGEHRRIGAHQSLEADLVDAAERFVRRAHLPRAQRGVLLLRQAVAAQQVGLAARRGLAERDGLLHALEGADAQVAQRGDDQHVAPAEAGDLAVDGLLAAQVRQLSDDGEPRGDVLELARRRADVDGDDHFAAGLAHHVDRQVVRARTVDQQAPVDLHRPHGARDGHARPQRAREAAALEHHGGAGLDVGRHRAERDRQLRKILHAGRALRQPADRALDADAGDDAFARDDGEPAHAELRPEQALVVILLQARRDLAARRAVAEHRVPVGARDELRHLLRRRARRERAADHRAHAGPGDAVDRHAQFLEHLEHAQMRGAPRAAARQREADLRTHGRRLAED